MKKLKSATAYRYDLSAFTPDSEGKGYKFTFREFDTQGRPTNMTYYTTDGEERLTESWKYDEAGRMIEEESNHIEEEMLEKTTRKYDNAGNLVEEADYYADELFERQVYEYDSKNNCIKRFRLDEEGVEMEKDFFEYDENSKLLRHTHFDEGGENDWTIEVAYDERGNIIEEIKKDVREKKYERTAYEYNDKNERVHAETKNEKGIVIDEHTDEYDDNGNHIHAITRAALPYATHTTRSIEYDEQNRPVESQVVDELNNYLTAKETISYDEHGQIAEHELFELRGGQGMTKTHFRLTYENEYAG